MSMLWVGRAYSRGRRAIERSNSGSGAAVGEVGEGWGTRAIEWSSSGKGPVL